MARGELVLREAERSALLSLAARRNTAPAMALRCRIVQACAAGAQDQGVALELDARANTVGKLRRRFIAERLDGWRDEPRSGAPHSIHDSRIEAVIVQTPESLPPAVTHWNSRGMARAAGLSTSAVQRIWRAFGLQPHRPETFKLCRPPPTL